MTTNFAQVIALGQRWKTRGGAVVRVTADRDPPAGNSWRWVTDNGEIVHEDDGRCSLVVGREHKNDLVELVEEQT